jgi:hypothetical protein
MIAESTITILIITNIFALLSTLGTLLYKSKCSKLVLCCLEIDRDTDKESSYDNLELQYNQEKSHHTH